MAAAMAAYTATKETKLAIDETTSQLQEIRTLP